MLLNFLIRKTPNIFSLFLEKERERLSAILTEQEFGFFEVLFFEKNRQSVWKQAREHFSESKIKHIRKLFDSHLPTLQKSWGNHKKELLQVQRSLYKELEKSFRVSDHIVNITGIKNRKKLFSTPVYLIETPQEEPSAWFSWEPDKTFISLLVSYGYNDSSSFLLAIVMHEFFHLALRENVALLNLIKQCAQDVPNITSLEKMPKEQVLEELVISSFLPEGYLGKTFFHTNMTNKVGVIQDFQSLRRFVAEKLSQQAHMYVETGKTIDQQYLENLIAAIGHK
jgi:hypothetical protein